MHVKPGGGNELIAEGKYWPGQDGNGRYIEFVTDHFSIYALVYEQQPSGGGTADPGANLKWWQKLPDWLQWLLRVFCLGWLWMRF